MENTLNAESPLDAQHRAGSAHPPLRRLVYGILIAVSAGAVLGRLLNTVYLIETWTRNWPTERPATYPTLSSNDRSRWATVRALVDHGTYVVGQRVIDPEMDEPQDSGIRFEDGFRGVDYVMHPEPVRSDPKTYHFYSSKPPLLSTMLAAPYWVLKQITGWTLGQQSTEVVRTLLAVVNWIPLIAYLAVLARLVERFGQTDWGRVYVMTAAALGTFLTTFCVTLNNHIFAAFGVIFVVYFMNRIFTEDQPRWWIFPATGLFTGFTIANELPAAALAAGVFLLLLWRAPRQTLLGFLPAVVLVGAAFELTNYLAIGRWVPAYSYRNVHDPDDPNYPWYHYEGSHWARENIRGIDAADEPKAVYALHVLVGHHGIFSLSPIFLLSVWGTFRALRRPGLGDRASGVGNQHSGIGDRAPSMESRPETPNPKPQTLDPSHSFRALAALTFIVSVIVLTFYILYTNNYGGNTSGFRWSFWLIPLWLLMMLPAADRLARSRGGRALALVLLAVSVLSASFPTWNPWRPPWLYRFLEYLELIHYS